MPENWKTYKLGEILGVKHGYAFKGKHFTTDPNGYLLLTPGNFEPNGGVKFNWGKQKFYKGEFPEEYICSKDDLLIAMTDLTQSCIILGSPLVIKDDKYHYLHNQRLGLIQENEALVDKMYLYHYFNDYTFRQRLIATKSGSTVSHTAPDRIYDCDIYLPPLPEQHAIASILTALDDKIENNLAMNKTLEDMAMALYKHWFVDFEPFQDGTFIDSELGPIPEGWEVKKLKNVADVGSSKRIFRKEYVENGVPFFRGKEVIQLSSGKGISTELFISENRFSEILKKYGAPEKNDILISSVGTIGVSWMVENSSPFYFKDGNLTWIKNYSTQVTGAFISQWLKSNETQAQIESATIGSTQKALTITALKELNLALPPAQSSMVEEISGKLVLWNETCLNNKREIETLTHLRDTLLPKLIRGEVRVKDIEEIVSEAL